MVESHESQPSVKRISLTWSRQRILAVASVLLMVIGFVCIAKTKHSYTLAFVRDGGFILTIGGWLLAILLARQQDYHYALPVVANQFQRGRLPLDERELMLRRKAFEQSYMLVAGVFVFAALCQFFVGHSLYIDGVWISRPYTWLILDILVLFLFLPSLIAALHDNA